VLLQVVCRRLWIQKFPLVRWPAEHTSEEVRQITLDDVERLGDTDNALADYYAEQVGQIATTHGTDGVSERAIRQRFDRKLIDEQEARRPVLMGESETEELDNQVWDALVAAHLVRREQWGRVTWFELAHDRLIDPVRTDNMRWFRDNLEPWQRQAEFWASRDRLEGLLLHDHQALAEAEDWAKEHEAELTPIDEDFLRDSRKVNLEPWQRLAELWASRGEPEGLLLHDHQTLAEAEDWVKTREAELAPIEGAFLRASRKLQDSVDLERRTSRLMLALSSVLFILSLIAAFLGVKFWQSAKPEKQ
jgi:hypothetical protein